MLALNFFGDLPFSAIVTRMYSGVDSFTLLAIPFFIAAGEIMNESGITDKIVSFSKNLVGIHHLHNNNNFTVHDFCNLELKMF